MTTIIDHAINIPSPTQIVWALASNPELFPRWHNDCQRVAFLTTQRRGKGTRLRCMGDSGKEYVMEISAWYEGLGYEYKIIDGGPYETNQGRIRLQEIAEGTVVQWTFSYSMAGVLGSLRNMGVKRAAEGQVIDSLRNLYRFVRDSAGESNIKVIKSMMQDAPDVDQRATYTPRHPSQYDEERIRQSGSTARPVPVQRTTMRPIIDEPLPADDDTQRNRPVTPPAASAPVEAPLVRPPTQPQMPRVSPNPDAAYLRPPTAPTRPPSEPTRPPNEPRRDYSTTIPPVPQTPAAPNLDSRPAAYLPSDPRPPTQPRPAPLVPRSAADIPQTPARGIDPLTTPPPLPEVRTPSSEFPPTIMSRPPSTSIPPVPPATPDRPASVPPTIPDRPASTSIPPVAPPPPARATSTSMPPVAPTRATSTSLPPVPDKPASVGTDTGKMSVFELFGLPKPSETQAMKAVVLPSDPVADPAAAQTPPISDALVSASVAADPSTESEAARAAFQAGMPQTGDLTPEPVRQGWRAQHRRQMLALRRPTKSQ